MRTGVRVPGWWLSHPWVDCLVFLVVTSCPWLILGAPIPDEDARSLLYTTTSAAAGIALAAATFVCTMFYQASGDLVTAIRKRFGTTLRRNWVWVLSSLLMAVVLPVAAIVVDAFSGAAGTAMVGASLVIMITSFYRVIYWFSNTLHVLEAEDPEPVPVRVKNLPE